MPADNATVITCDWILANILWEEEFDIKPGSLGIWKDQGSRCPTDKALVELPGGVVAAKTSQQFLQDCSSLNPH